MRRKRTDSVGDGDEEDGGRWEGLERRVSSSEEGLMASREEMREELKLLMDVRRLVSSRTEGRVCVVRVKDVGCFVGC